MTEKKPDRKICIGWSGSHSTSQYMLLLENVFKTISKRYNVRFKVMGDKYFSISGVAIEAKDWDLNTEVRDLQDIDRGLYPLPKVEWVLGKGGLKALQYMGIGRPCICTRYGAVLEFIEDGVNGFLADSEEGWVEKLSMLVENPSLRCKIGENARRTVEENYSVNGNASKYLAILKEVYEKRRLISQIRVFFVVPYPKCVNHDQKFRYEGYLDVLNSNNIEYAIRPFASRRFYEIFNKQGYVLQKFLHIIVGFFYRMWNVIEASNFDIIYICRETFPFGPAFFEWLLSRWGKPIVFDYDGPAYPPYSKKTAKIMKLCKHVILSDESLDATKFLDIINAVHYKKPIEKKTKIHILELITDLDIGGTPTFLSSLVERLDRNKYHIVVCSLKQKSRHSVSELIENIGIRVVFINAEKGIHAFTALSKLYFLLKDERIDVIHNWLFHSNVFGTLAGKMAKVPCIISSARSIDLKKNLLRIMLDRIALRVNDLVLANAEAVRNVLIRRERIPPSKIVVIQTGIDLDRFKRKPKGAYERLQRVIGEDSGPIIVSVARLHAVKGHIFLLKAMVNILQEEPGAKLVLVGNGPMEKRLKSKARDYGIEDSIIFLGVEPNANIPQILMCSDIFALPSIEEGLPCSILEAMGMEVPMVVTNVGGVEEIVKYDQTGFMAERCNPNDLSKVILKVANDPDGAKKVAKAARQKLERNFDIRVMTRKIEGLYDKLHKAKNDGMV